MSHKTNQIPFSVELQLLDLNLDEFVLIKHDIVDLQTLIIKISKTTTLFNLETLLQTWKFIGYIKSIEGWSIILDSVEGI